MQNEKDHLDHYKVFEHNHDFETLFGKIDNALLVKDVLDNIVFLHLIDYYKFLLLVCLFH